MLRVSRQSSGDPEIFYSLQGEGVTTGKPTVFLRLAQCNLACTWCDTKYTWDWQNYDYQQEVLTLSEKDVEDRILAFRCSNLVITGGEPLMQQKALAPLALSLKNQGFCCEIETNGTLVPQPEMIAVVSQWNVSPKLSNSGNIPLSREIVLALQAFVNLENSYFKFVIVDPTDIDEAYSLVRRYDIPPNRVVLMPEGVTPDILSTRGKWVAQACIELGFLFSSRLHILLWGNERGR